MSKTKVKKREKVRNTTKKKMRCFKMVISHEIIIYKFLYVGKNDS